MLVTGTPVTLLGGRTEAGRPWRLVAWAKGFHTWVPSARHLCFLGHHGAFLLSQSRAASCRVGTAQRLQCSKSPLILLGPNAELTCKGKAGRQLGYKKDQGPAWPCPAVPCPQECGGSNWEVRGQARSRHQIKGSCVVLSGQVWESGMTVAIPSRQPRTGNQPAFTPNLHPHL